MPYDVGTCAHNKVCTNCPSRIDCDMRKLFYCEKEYLEIKNRVFSRGYSFAQARGFTESESWALAKESIATMDRRRTEELKLHPQYSET